MLKDPNSSLRLSNTLNDRLPVQRTRRSFYLLCFFLLNKLAELISGKKSVTKL